MKSNPLLKWLLIPMALLLVFVGFKLLSGGDRAPAQQGAGQLTADEAKALGIEGDTPRDTVATLVAQVKQLRTELQTALTDNKSQREENQRLRQRAGRARDQQRQQQPNGVFPTAAVHIISLIKLKRARHGTCRSGLAAKYIVNTAIETTVCSVRVLLT